MRMGIWGVGEAHFHLVDFEDLRTTGGWRVCRQNMKFVSLNRIDSQDRRRLDLRTSDWQSHTLTRLLTWRPSYMTADVAYRRLLVLRTVGKLVLASVARCRCTFRRFFAGYSSIGGRVMA
jgi:hypothetical protein